MDTTWNYDVDIKEKSVFFSILLVMSGWNLMLSQVEHKKVYNLGPGSICYNASCTLNVISVSFDFQNFIHYQKWCPQKTLHTLSTFPMLPGILGQTLEREMTWNIWMSAFRLVHYHTISHSWLDRVIMRRRHTWTGRWEDYCQRWNSTSSPTIQSLSFSVTMVRWL